jgi:hypothetical protein
MIPTVNLKILKRTKNNLFSQFNESFFDDELFWKNNDSIISLARAKTNPRTQKIYPVLYVGSE